MDVKIKEVVFIAISVLMHIGSCQDSSGRDCASILCDYRYDPMCDWDDTSYWNRCTFQQTACREPGKRIKCSGTCPCSLRQTTLAPQPPCNFVTCHAIYQPVCGTNGRTYGNLCALQNDNCNTGNQVEVHCNTACPCGTCDPSPCPAVYQPVCGTNGRTYENLCALQNDQCNTQVEVQCNTACPCSSSSTPGSPPRPCPTCMPINSPVCGSDGQTYRNSCFLESTACGRSPGQLRVACNGVCPCTGDPCIEGCTKEYDPVCGSNQQTYGNQCLLENAACEDPSITLQCGRECPCGDQCIKGCARLYDPVCGSNQQTYGNQCELENAACDDSSITLQCGGECPCAVQCNNACPDVYSPVCGTNLRTYENSCTLELWKCVNPGSVEFACNGECPCPNACNRNCLLLYNPICGNNGRTYPNNCTLGDARCGSSGNIDFACNGECPCRSNICDRGCSTLDDPVCDYDGTTYPNRCVLEIARCQGESSGFRCQGECPCPNVVVCGTIGGTCSPQYVPVCGSNGVTYFNLCHLGQAQCDETLDHIRLACDGTCPCTNCRIESCSAQSRPMCGTNGVTYRSRCHLTNDACSYPAEGIRLACIGTCPCRQAYCDTMSCDYSYNPICGSDGISYWNPCTLAQSSCRDRQGITLNCRNLCPCN